MSVYAESSAVLAWLLGESNGARVRRSLSTADTVCASELTLVECDRALVRGVHVGEIKEAEAARRSGELARAAAHWLVLAVSDEVLSRARRPFPTEPIRTLDALHLSSALLVRSASPEVSVLALDERIRRCAEALGFEVVP